jgi:TonB family protein
MPVYPAIARSARVQGIVIVDVAVQPSGRVSDARIIKSIPLFDQAALEALRLWQFEPPVAPTTMRVTATFTLTHGFPYPRPSRFVQPRPSWVPDNFAFTYEYECRRTNVEIDSIDRLVGNARGPGAREFAFSFEGDRVAEAFTLLDRAGVFDASGGRSRGWREMPDFRQHGNELFITVAAEAPPLIDVSLSSSVQFFGGPPEQFSHVLAVRYGDQWKEVRWSEPLDRHAPPLDKAVSAAAKRIRTLVRDALVPSGSAPACL